MARDERPLRIWKGRYRACMRPPVMGPMKRSSATSRSASSPAKRSMSAAGSRPGSTGGMNAARATCQNGVAVNTPPCAPPLDGAAIDADHLGQLPHAQRRCAVPQDRDQYHDRGNVDLGAEEAQRRRRRPRPAAIDRAAEAEAPVVLTPEAAGPATRLAPIVSRMNNAVASLASGTPSGIGEVAITGEQQLVECSVGQQVSVQAMRPPRLVGADHNGQARTQ